MKFFCFFFFLSLIVNAQELTIDEIVDLALEKNFNITQSNRSLKISRLNASKSMVDFYPTVDLVGSYLLRQSEFFEQINEQAPEQSISSSDTGQIGNRNLEGRIEVNYLFFNGFRRSYYLEKLINTYKIQEIEAKRIIENVVLDIYQKVYAIQELYLYSETLKQKIDLTEIKLIKENAKFNYGNALEIDVLIVRKELNNLINELNNIERKISVQKQKLNFIIGNELNDILLLKYEEAQLSFLNLDEILNNLIENNLDLISTKKNIDLTLIDKKIANSRYYPEIGFIYSFGGSILQEETPTLSFSGFDINNINTNYVDHRVGLNLRWNIFSGGKRRINDVISDIEYYNAKENYINKEKELRLEAFEYWSIYHENLNLIKQLNGEIEIAEVILAKAKINFENGLLDTIELTEKQNEFFELKRKLSVSKMKTKLIELKLLYISGKLVTG